MLRNKVYVSGVLLAWESSRIPQLLSYMWLLHTWDEGKVYLHFSLCYFCNDF